MMPAPPIPERKRAYVQRSAPPPCPGDVPGVVSPIVACKGCGKPVVFVTMRSGKKMPCHAEPVSGDWKRNLVVVFTPREGKHKGHAAGDVFTKAPSTVTGRVPHWAGCPARDAFKP